MCGRRSVLAQMGSRRGRLSRMPRWYGHRHRRHHYTRYHLLYKQDLEETFLDRDRTGLPLDRESYEAGELGSGLHY